MKKYRLKEEAVPFFKESLAYGVFDYETWTSNLNVNDKALEEVEPVYLTFGHMNKDRNSGSLCGWDDSGSHFYFTIFLPSVKYMDHDKFTKGKVTRDLMNIIQRHINIYFEEFNNKEQ